GRCRRGLPAHAASTPSDAGAAASATVAAQRGPPHRLRGPEALSSRLSCRPAVGEPSSKHLSSEGWNCSVTKGLAARAPGLAPRTGEAFPGAAATLGRRLTRKLTLREPLTYDSRPRAAGPARGAFLKVVPVAQADRASAF